MVVRNKRSSLKMRSSIDNRANIFRRRSIKFWALSALLVIVFLAGGSARSEVPSLIILRPVSILLAFYAVLTTNALSYRTYRWPISIIFGVLVLTVFHIVPLPPVAWRMLPGRDIIADIVEISGNSDPWLPLAMVPAAAWNAFFSLAVPIAAFFLAIQLSESDNYWLLISLIGLCLISAALGFLQATGMEFKLYAISSNVSGLFANRNHQATLLAISVPLAASVAFLARRTSFDQRIVSIAAVFVIIALLPLLLVTGSRMGLVVYGISVLGIYFLYPSYLNRRFHVLSARGKLLLCGFSAILFGMIALVGKITSRNEAVSRFGEVDDEVRYSVWRQVGEVIPDYMPWGSGVGSYPEIYQIHEPAAFLIPTYSNHAHNDWLELIMTTGVPGVVLMAYVVLTYCVAAWRSGKMEGHHAVLNRLGILLIMVLAIASIVDYPLRTPILAAVGALATAWASRPNPQTCLKKGQPVNV